MRLLYLFLLFSLPLSLSAKEDCSLQAIGITETDAVEEALFYQGTCHYRNADYHYSAKYWQELAAIDNVASEYQELQISSLNNLGYLLFFGYGIEQNQSQAIQYWSKAVSLGHEESEYHLCHAFADSNQPTYDLEKARIHCRKAESIYLEIDNIDDQDLEVLRQIQGYLSKINKTNSEQ